MPAALPWIAGALIAYFGWRTADTLSENAAKIAVAAAVGGAGYLVVKKVTK